MSGRRKRGASAADRLAVAQGAFYRGTGVWPLLGDTEDNGDRDAHYV